MELKRMDRGFSVVEVLIASLIFLIIAVGILPLFAASMRNNLEGREATEISNFGRSAVEDLLQAPFNDPSLTIPGGSTVLTVDQHFSKAEQIWKNGTGGSDALWRRTIQVRQFSIPKAGEPEEFDDPLDGSTDIGQVHFKEIRVQVWHGRSPESVALGGGRRFSVRMLKSI
jgi:prepilin-type N-terminal cleavage/methylation domain-containing protein